VVAKGSNRFASAMEAKHGFRFIQGDYIAAGGGVAGALYEATEIVLRAERRLGEVLDEMVRQGQNGRESNIALLSDLGISKMQSSRWRAERRLGEVLDEMIKHEGGRPGKNGNAMLPLSELGITKMQSSRLRAERRLGDILAGHSPGRGGDRKSSNAMILDLEKHGITKMQSSRWRAERRLGDILVGMEKAQGKRTDLVTSRDQVDSYTLSELGITKMQSSRLRAERKLGGILAKTPVAKGSDKGGRKKKIDGSRLVPSNVPPTLAEIGISKKTSSRARN
jgi:hypothetical protein